MFDKKAIKASFGRAAANYDAHALLQQKIREDAVELANEYFSQTAKVLDLGCGTAALSAENWDIIGVDIAFGMCAVAKGKNAKIINAAADALPLQDASVDGVFSSLMLQWVERPELVIKEILRVLKPDGVAIISTFVRGTLCELADAFSTLDAAPHVSEFMEGEQLLMRTAHVGGVVLDVSDVTYEQEVKNAVELMRSIKNIGAGNKSVNRKKGMMTSAQLAKVEAAYVGNIASWRVLTMVVGKK